MVEVFSYRLSSLRLEREFSQNEVSRRIGIEQSLISKWELGRNLPDVLSLIKLANFFHVSIDYLVGLSDVR